MRARSVTMTILALAAVVLLGIGRPATGHAAGLPAPGCLGCTLCPVGHDPLCRATVFASETDYTDKITMTQTSCQSAGCGNGFSGVRDQCGLVSLEQLRMNYDPNFNAVRCADEIALGNSAAPMLSPLALAGLTVSMLGIAALALRRQGKAEPVAT
jgi:hypothetical protein